MKFKLKRLHGECVDVAADITGEELVGGEQHLSSFFRKYESGGGTGSKELHEIESTVYEKGYILLWSSVLKDCIAFYNMESDLVQVPSGFVAYNTEELWHLFGDEDYRISPNVLRRIHEAKKTGAVIIDVREDQP